MIINRNRQLRIYKGSNKRRGGGDYKNIKNNNEYYNTRTTSYKIRL